MLKDKVCFYYRIIQYLNILFVYLLIYVIKTHFVT